jgi:hypothetical protein
MAGRTSRTAPANRAEFLTACEALPGLPGAMVLTLSNGGPRRRRCHLPPEITRVTGSAAHVFDLGNGTYLGRLPADLAITLQEHDSLTLAIHPDRGRPQYLGTAAAVGEGAAAVGDGASAMGDGASAMGDGASAMGDGASVTGVSPVAAAETYSEIGPAQDAASLEVTFTAPGGWSGEVFLYVPSGYDLVEVTADGGGLRGFAGRVVRVSCRFGDRGRVTVLFRRRPSQL